jgi:hypothetical protein
MGWMEEPVETEDGKGVMGWLSPKPCHLDFKVVVASWLDWGWAECWRQLGVRSLALMAFTEEALSLGKLIWRNEHKIEGRDDFLNLYREECDVYVCHLPCTQDLETFFGCLLELRPRVWMFTLACGGESKREITRVVEASAVGMRAQGYA